MEIQTAVQGIVRVIRLLLDMIVGTILFGVNILIWIIKALPWLFGITIILIVLYFLYHWSRKLGVFLSKSKESQVTEQKALLEGYGSDLEK